MLHHNRVQIKTTARLSSDKIISPRCYLTARTELVCLLAVSRFWMHIRPVSLLSLRQLDRLWCSTYVCDAACKLDTLRRADLSYLTPASSLHTHIQYAQADNSQRVDPTTPLDGLLLEKPEEPGPEDCCQVCLAAKCTNTAHRRLNYQWCNA